MNNTGIHNLINGVSADYLNVNDRAIHYGDGLFETILFSNNQLYYWQQHYQRLLQSATQLKLKCPHEQLLLNDIKQLLMNNEISQHKTCAIKIIVSRGAGDRGYQFRQTAVKENRIVSLSSLNASYSSLLSGSLLSGDLYLCQQQVSINEGLAGIKHLNRLENVLARNEWHGDQSKNIIDGLMLNANHHVIEGCMSNLFAVKDNQIFTPDLKLSGVNGIMRNVIIDAAKNNKIRVNIVDLTIDELASMHEIFISNSLIGMKSVNKIGKTLYQQQNISNVIFKTLLATTDHYVQTV